MSEQIVYRKLKRYKYQTLETYGIQTDLLTIDPVKTDGGWITLQDGWLEMRPGYCWDGASGPTIDTPSSMRGSLVHDALYQLMREGLLSQEYRVPADNLFEKICIEDGMGKFRAWYYRRGLYFAGFAAKRNDGPEIVRITAPKEKS